MGDFARAGLVQARRLLVRVERVGGVGQTDQRADRQPHGEPAAEHKQEQLGDQHIGQPSASGISEGCTSMVSGLPSLNVRCA